MTPTADFYDGRGPHAVWLGSLQGDADPATMRKPLVRVGEGHVAAARLMTEKDAVLELLQRGDGPLGCR
jgi:hypothetical protein